MIDILMATYNGERYLREQLDSIFAQTCEDWQLLIRDDNSTDSTCRILAEYVAKYPTKVRVVDEGGSRLGASLNFGRLLEYSDSDYIMFSDQDDVWLPSKIELSLGMMKAAEYLYPATPLLVHSDLKVVDANLSPVEESMWRRLRVSPRLGDNASDLMVQGLVSGCALMINRKARKISTPIPREAIMYDWWISIRVATHGKIIYMSLPTLLHRLHRMNTVGVTRVDANYFARKLMHLNAQFRAYREVLAMIEKTGHPVTFPWFIRRKTHTVIGKFLYHL